jgi:N-acetyl sugar amidotransferase
MIKKSIPEKKKKYILPSEVKFCTKCGMSNQRPRITFDEDDVCSACKYTDIKNNEIKWDDREEELIKLLDKHRRNDGRYDVIVPSSGGKDSAYVAHVLKFKYGMNPLTVTWAPHVYTDIGFQNHQAHILTGDLANILMAPPGKTHRNLTKLAVEILGDPFLPFNYGQNNAPMQVAKLYDIPLIFYGENTEVEYGGLLDTIDNPTRDWKSVVDAHHHSGIAPKTFLDYGISEKELAPYMSPSTKDLEKIGLEIHYMGYYHKWTPQENFYYCVENTGFKPNPVRSEGTYSKYASIDCKIDGFHYYFMFIKFGFGRASSDAAHEVRDGHITREEAVALIERYDGEFPKNHFQLFLDYCSISEEYFFDLIDSWRPDHIWRKIDNKWKLRHTIGGNGTDD